jgi:hypothetical protein
MTRYLHTGLTPKFTEVSVESLEGRFGRELGPIERTPIGHPQAALDNGGGGDDGGMAGDGESGPGFSDRDTTALS